MSVLVNKDSKIIVQGFNGKEGKFHATTMIKYGTKGVGEGGAIPPPAAIVNAVNDALRHLNAELAETPLSPRRVLAAIAEASAQTSKRSTP